MKIRTKIVGTLLGMSLLVALVGALAVNRQRASALVAATKEAENVARVLGFLMSESGEQRSYVQDLVSRLHQTQGRDVCLVDSQQRILADAHPKDVGRIFETDRLDEVGATIKDRQVRTFVEVSEDYPSGVRQIVVPVEGANGEVLGAVILEHTPLYNELMRLTEITTQQVSLAAASSAAIGFLVALFMGRSIAKPLRQLTNAATRFAAGETDLPMPLGRQDEIGELASAFSTMFQRRQQAEQGLRQAHNELEQRVKERTAELAEANAVLQQEVAERRLAEEAVKNSELRFRQLADNINNVFWMATPHGEELLYVSPAYERIWGRTCASVYARPLSWFEAITPADQPSVADALGRNAAGQNIDIEYRITRPDGAVRWIHDRGFPVRDEAGRVIRVCGLAEDITSRKQMEAELEEAEKQLRDASRQAGMAEVATSVLHNVGNVLNSINVSTTLVVDGVKKSKVASLGRVVKLLDKHAEDLARYISIDPQGRNLPAYLRQLNERLLQEQQSTLHEVELLRENIDHIKEIVSMQQSYATVSGVTERVRVADLVEDSLRMNGAALLRHEVEVIRDFHEVPQVTLEKHKVLQILVNLIRNAKYACDEGGRKDKRITLGVANGDGRIKISVSDTGIGIPPENLTRIFNHGFTTRKEGHGFGLHSGALAAMELGGALTVHSDGIGHGATFTLELPAPGLGES